MAGMLRPIRPQRKSAFLSLSVPGSAVRLSEQPSEKQRVGRRPALSRTRTFCDDRGVDVHIPLEPLIGNAERRHVAIVEAFTFESHAPAVKLKFLEDLLGVPIRRGCTCVLATTGRCARRLSSCPPLIEGPTPNPSGSIRHHPSGQSRAHQQSMTRSRSRCEATSLDIRCRKCFPALRLVCVVLARVDRI